MYSEEIHCSCPNLELLLLGTSFSFLARPAPEVLPQAAAALADQLVVREVPVVAIGNRAQGELFAPTVGCRVFPPGAGVDLAALCRNGSG